MNKRTLLMVTVLTAALALNIKALAQKKGEVMQNQPVTADIQVDGRISDWDPANFVMHEETRLSYLIGNDDRNLYLTIRTSDKEKISKIISRGVTFTVNNKGKKKEGSSITFPVTRPARPSSSKATDRNKVLQERLESSKEIRVQGLTKMMDGGISIVNEYGIKAAATLDSTQTLGYELAVPLEQLGVSLNSNLPMAISIRINGIVPPRMQPGPRSPYESMRTGGYTRTDFPEALQPEEFWIKRTLNPHKK